MANRVEFVSYDGKYPNLCSGNLVLSVDGQRFDFPSYCLASGGCVSFDKDWNESVTSGRWAIRDWPEDFPADLKEQATDVVNDNVRHGCCGGCV